MKLPLPKEIQVKVFIHALPQVEVELFEEDVLLEENCRSCGGPNSFDFIFSFSEMCYKLSGFQPLENLFCFRCISPMFVQTNNE